MNDQASQLATLDAETIARELDWATAANGIATLRTHGESAAADALALLAAHCEAWARTAERRQVMLNAANAMNGVHQRTITRLREQLEQAQAAPGPAGLTRVWSGYDDDECWFPMFANLADAKAYAEQEYRAQCTGYGTKAPDELAWSERKAYTEAHGYPGLYDLETDSGFVVCELLVHASLASGLVERPIETDEETAEPAPQVEGQGEIPLTGQQASAAEGETPREFRVGDLVQITGRGEGFDGKTGVVTEIDASDVEFPIGLTIDGFAGLAWCDPSEIRHADQAAAESGAAK